MFIRQTESKKCQLCGEDHWATREFHVCSKAKEILDVLTAKTIKWWLDKFHKKWVYRHEGD